jgi:hypothetical protein
MLYLNQQGQNAKAIWRSFLKIGLLNSAGNEWPFRTIDRWLKDHAYEVDAANWPADVEMKLRPGKKKSNR